MRSKLTVVLIGGILAVASGTATAGSNVSVDISFGLPVYRPAPVYVAPPVAYPYHRHPRVIYPAPQVRYGPRDFLPPRGVIYVAPAYVVPGPGYVRVHRRGHGWGWRHPRHGWHRDRD